VAAPSPLADATRFIEPALTSPAAKIPGTVVSSAAGDVRAGSMKRVASASGEGAATVALVHAHLNP
jgi:hypothetical protein